MQALSVILMSTGLLWACHDKNDVDCTKPSGSAPARDVLEVARKRTNFASEIDVLVTYRNRSGSTAFDQALRLLVDTTCKHESWCERARVALAAAPPARRGAIPLEPVGSVALALAQAPRTREVAFLVACSLCTEQGVPCDCDGHACSADEVFPRDVPLLATTVQCGGLIVRGSTVRWGRAMQKVDSIYWTPDGNCAD